jgi:hypothetical protein
VTAVPEEVQQEELLLTVARPHHCLMLFQYEGREVFAVRPDGETWLEEGWTPEKVVDAFTEMSRYHDPRINEMLRVKDLRVLYGRQYGLEAEVRDRRHFRKRIAAKTPLELVKRLAAFYREEYTAALINDISTLCDPPERVVAQMLSFREPGRAFPQPVVLVFDPEEAAAKSDPAEDGKSNELADTPFGEVWRDREARILWMGIRGGRLVDQYFNGWMVVIAGWVRQAREKGILTAQVLRSYLWRADCFGTSEDVMQHAMDLLPYLLGQKEFQWVVLLPTREEGRDE